jgi:transcriptional regulator with XRE-family HTH domain
MNEDLQLDLGHKIKILREMKGLSQEAVAMDLGISQQAFQKIESGKTKLNLSKANDIAKALDMNIETLLSFHPANYLNNCSQSGIMSTYNIMSDQLIEQVKEQNAILKSQLEFMREQNAQLLNIIAKLKDNSQ